MHGAKSRVAARRRTLGYVEERAIPEDDKARRERRPALPETTAAAYGYDSANRLTSLENRKSDQTAIATYDFTTLDGNGNRTSVTQTEPYTTLPATGSNSYTYNSRRTAYPRRIEHLYVR